MGETDYNALLYDKMKAEQDKYRDWLLSQPPEEILNHTYEYTMREDIVMCMEELELSPKQAKALLRSPCPLDDVYKEFKDREVEHKQAQQIGMEFVRKMWGKRFQVVVTTHLNTKHLHCHFVINSVSFVDGKRLQDKEKSWRYFRHIADEICLEHKLSIVEKPELNRSPAYLTMKDKAGMPTRYNNAKKAIDEAIAMSRNLRQFQYELGVMGYHSNFSPNRKYATVTPKGSEKPIRTYRLGEEYTKEKIIERLTANRDSIVFKPFQPKTYPTRFYAGISAMRYFQQNHR